MNSVLGQLEKELGLIPIILEQDGAEKAPSKPIKSANNRAYNVKVDPLTGKYVDRAKLSQLASSLRQAIDEELITKEEINDYFHDCV